MLNIEDIKKRLKKYPEPDEVGEIRNQIKERFKNLEFIEDGHKYYLTYPDGRVKEMQSVSSVCHMFEPEVDWEGILERKAAHVGIDKEIIRREWKENNITSTSNGTLTHLFAEAYMHFFMGNIDLMPDVIRKMQYEDGFLIPYGSKQMAVAKYYEDMYDIGNFYPIMPEAQIYIDSENNPHGIKYDVAGTFDALFAFIGSDNNIKLSIRDWKTNKSLFKPYNESNNITLNYPFDDFIEEPKSTYTIQLSMYQLGLEPLGYQISDRKLLWLTEADNGSYCKIDVPDITERLKKELSVKKS